jgi:vacuolar protein 8
VQRLGQRRGEGRGSAGNLALALDDDIAAAVAMAGASIVPPLVELLHRGSDKGKAKAAMALRDLMAANDANNADVLAAGGIPLLVELLRGGSDEGKSNAARALGNFAISNDANNAVIVAAG